jgi:HAL2 family 3'(2'),5'-bisphosphate nucleotidase
VTAVESRAGLALERRFAIEAVAAASRLTQAVRRDFVPAEAVSKADASPVTVADLGAQAAVSLALAGTLPGDRLMGEEDAGPLRDAPDLAEAVLGRVRALRPGVSLADVLDALDRCDDHGGPGRRWWTLDPVDGTKGFLRDEQYAVALALVEDGEVVLAAMGCPNLPHAGEPGAPGPVGCLFIAVRGEGAWQRPLFETRSGPDDMEMGEVSAGWPIHVAAPRSPAEGRYAESVEAAHSDQSAAASIARALGITAEPLRLDSQAKYAVVARGDASIYLRLPHGEYRENVWDHAAGALIVSEAGGIVSDVEGRPLDVTTGRRLVANRGIVATAAPIHDAVLEAIRSAIR